MADTGGRRGDKAPLVGTVFAGKIAEEHVRLPGKLGGASRDSYHMMRAPIRERFLGGLSWLQAAIVLLEN